MRFVVQYNLIIAPDTID